MDDQREIKFRYILIYKDKIKIVFATLEEIEMGKMDEYLMSKSAKFREQDKVLVKDLYTGHHDKNDKEIYERDIMRLTDDNGQTFYTTVRWIDWNSGLSLVELKNWNKDIKNDLLIEPAGQYLANQEVIGNVIENPELLKWIYEKNK